ncbi:IRAG2-like protein [Mya arenaria]|uniref:IRAG2-like protein n=1 Tax=Mya arenaria TaxID=6604 RepID=A0ABY7EDT6_MYAAR|nr:IRAG2-like protein [Mya arenaria]
MTGKMSFANVVIQAVRASKSSEELSEQEIETLEKRLEIQERSRDIAEQNVDKELKGLRNNLDKLNQVCTDPEVREVLASIQTHINILEKSTARVSSRAEVFGAIQQEKRMSKAVDIMVHHVENIRRVHEREHAELEEARTVVPLPQPQWTSQGASRRRVSEIALPKVLGGTGAATLHPSASMDARSRFQAAVAHTSMKSAVANTLRKASLEKQGA